MMDQNKLDMYLMTNQKYFPPEKMNDLKNRLSAIDDQKFSQLAAVELKDPTTLLLVSIFLGGLGIDRFMLGETGMGILKLLTGGCFGILAAAIFALNFSFAPPMPKVSSVMR